MVLKILEKLSGILKNLLKLVQFRMVEVLLFVTFLCSSVTFAQDVSEEYCLAETIYFEARNQDLQGQIAVGLVAMNRVKSSKFPDTLCAVTRQAKRDSNGNIIKYKCQFSYYCDGLVEHVAEEEAWSTAQIVSKVVMEQSHKDFTDGALYYHTTKVNPYWSSVYQPTLELGDHIFYR